MSRADDLRKTIAELKDDIADMVREGDDPRFIEKARHQLADLEDELEDEDDEGE